MDNKNEEIEIIDIEEFNMTPETNGDSTSTNEPIQEDIIILTDAEEVTESLFGSPINEEKENIVWEKPVEEIDYLFDINEEMALESSTPVESQMREMEVENSKIRQDFMQEVEEYNKDVAETVIEDLDYTITGKVGAKNPYLDTEEVTKAFISSLYNSENSQDIEIVPETPLQTYDKNVIEKLDAYLVDREKTQCAAQGARQISSLWRYSHHLRACRGLPRSYLVGAPGWRGLASYRGNAGNAQDGRAQYSLYAAVCLPAKPHHRKGGDPRAFAPLPTGQHCPGGL